MSVRIERRVGAQILPTIAQLARLRITVFREYPYLYDGSLDYEENYLRTYAQSKQSVVVVAIDVDTIIGAATGEPMVDETPEVQRPFEAAGYQLDQVFYFGESVLLPSYRGQGLGVKFFIEREGHAQQQPGLKWTTFCAVDRPANHPQRPPNYVPLDEFWKHRGYTRQPQLQTDFCWRELEETEETAKPMVFWTKPWA